MCFFYAERERERERNSVNAWSMRNVATPEAYVRKNEKWDRTLCVNGRMMNLRGKEREKGKERENRRRCQELFGFLN